jgi:hypothetical protein
MCVCPDDRDRQERCKHTLLTRQGMSAIVPADLQDLHAHACMRADTEGKHTPPPCSTAIVAPCYAKHDCKKTLHSARTNAHQSVWLTVQQRHDNVRVQLACQANTTNPSGSVWRSVTPDASTPWQRHLQCCFSNLVNSARACGDHDSARTHASLPRHLHRSLSRCQTLSSYMQFCLMCLQHQAVCLTKHHFQDIPSTPAS